MKKYVQAQVAFEIWNKMMELENIFWKHYDEVFLDLILDKEEQKEIKTLENKIEKEDPFL